jgi:hypothetical protein
VSGKVCWRVVDYLGPKEVCTASEARSPYLRPPHKAAPVSCHASRSAAFARALTGKVVTTGCLCTSRAGCAAWVLVATLCYEGCKLHVDMSATTTVALPPRVI